MEIATLPQNTLEFFIEQNRALKESVHQLEAKVDTIESRLSAAENEIDLKAAQTSSSTTKNPTPAAMTTWFKAVYGNDTDLLGEWDASGDSGSHETTTSNDNSDLLAMTSLEEVSSNSGTLTTNVPHTSVTSPTTSSLIDKTNPDASPEDSVPFFSTTSNEPNSYNPLMDKPMLRTPGPPPKEKASPAVVPQSGIVVAQQEVGWMDDIVREEVCIKPCHIHWSFEVRLRKYRILGINHTQGPCSKSLGTAFRWCRKPGTRYWVSPEEYSLEESPKPRWVKVLPKSFRAFG